MDPSLTTWIQTGGLGFVVFFLLLVVRWGIARKWVFGWQFEAVVKERDELKTIVYDLAGVVKRQSQTTYEVIGKVEQKADPA